MPKKALVVIDVQNIFFAEGKYQLYKAEEVAEKINNLIKKARQNHIPLIFVRHQDPEYMQFGSYVWQVYDELDARKSDFYVEKKTPDSFFETGLQELLAENRIEEIYLCGMQTDYCIDTTCRSAFGKKIKAVLIEDAHSTYQTSDLEAAQIIRHHNKIIGHWFAELISANEVNFK